MILRNQYLSERLNEIKMQDDLALLSDSEDMNLLLYPYYDLKGQFFHLERYDWEKHDLKYVTMLSDVEETIETISLHQIEEILMKKTKSKQNGSLNINEYDFQMYSETITDFTEPGITTDLIRWDFYAESPLQKLCIGIGHYKTKDNKEFHLCVLLDLYDRAIRTYTIGQLFSEGLCGDVFQKLMLCIREAKGTPIIHSSRNRIYQSGEYKKLLNSHSLIGSMTEAGTKGGIAPISTFFSNLKRKMPGQTFSNLQDGVDWIEAYIFQYNIGCVLSEKKKK